LISDQRSAISAHAPFSSFWTCCSRSHARVLGQVGSGRPQLRDCGLPWPATQLAVFARGGRLRRRLGQATGSAHDSGHPLPRTEGAFQQRGQVEIGIQLWKVKTQAARADLDGVSGDMKN
jgi:hypothetical protein